MSATILSLVIGILAEVLPRIGIQVGSAELTTTVQTLMLLISGIGIYWGRYRQGDITPFGVKKN